MPPQHSSDLRKFHETGHFVARHFGDNLHNNSSTTMICGYHARPSLHPLHLHIISSDLDPKADINLKKHHVLSYVTEFFVRSEAVAAHVEGSFNKLEKVSEP